MRLLAWFLIALTTTGCSSWQASHLPVATNPAAIQPDPVKLRLGDQRTVMLHDWTLEGDTLRGARDAWDQGAHVMKPEAIALSAIAYREGGPHGEVLPDYLAAKQAEVAVAREQASAPAPPTKYPGEHRFKLVGGSTIELESATVDSDSLRG